jgi:predicted RNase H-like HicB family nuclease/post-segregation antitoxin (ccd killing protein)
MRYVYTAIFSPESDNKDALNVNFPDLPGCHTCGDGLDDAIKMAEDVLCLCLYDMEQESKPIPVATPPQGVKTEVGEFITAISVDTDNYRRFYENKAIKKTLTIPMWLNEKAEAANINFSQTLQKALKEELKLSS